MISNNLKNKFQKSVFGKLISILPIKQKKKALAVILLSLIVSIVEIIGIASVFPFLIALTDPELARNSYIFNEVIKFFEVDSRNNSNILFVSAGLFTLSIILLASITRTVVRHISNRFIEEQRFVFGSMLLNKYLAKDYEFYFDRNTDEMSKLILSEVDQVAQNVLRPLIMMISYGFLIVSISLLLFILDPHLASLLAIIIIAIYVGLYKFLRNKMNKIGHSRYQSNDMRFKTVSEIFQDVKYLKLTGSNRLFVENFDTHSKIYSTRHADYMTLSQLPSDFLEALLFAAILVVAYTFILNGASQTEMAMVVPLLGIYALAALRLKPALQAIYHGFLSLEYGRDAVNKLYLDLSETRTLTTGTAKENITFEKSIILRDLSYEYPGSSGVGFSCANVEIKKGHIIGLVGETGSGKTTFVDLLLLLLKPQTGKILVDGIEITDDHVDQYRKFIGYVPQTVRLLDGDLNSNIAFGEKLEKSDIEKIKEVVELTELSELVTQLKKGLHTNLGKNGIKLSGGQIQRIGIARALYLNPDLLILDEATNALDPQTERLILHKLFNRFRQPTIIMITHNHDLLKYCDQIITLRRGRIVEIRKGERSDAIK